MPAQAARSAKRDEQELFTQHARRLDAVVSRSAHLGGERRLCLRLRLASAGAPSQPPAVAFAWQCATAVREAIKLGLRSARAIGLDQLVEIAAEPTLRPEGSLELIAAGE
jgi:hypothetical protein